MQIPTTITSHLTLLHGATAFSPAALGDVDILIGGSVIVDILRPLSETEIQFLRQTLNIEIVDCSGCIIIPGLIDCHVHLTGGGGELGPTSRTPSAKLSEIIMAGVTTVIGCLGTDTITRSPHDLIAYANSLQHSGISAKVWFGGYRYPPVTVSGDIMKDIVSIDPVIGIGELAISDFRGSNPTRQELTRLAQEVNVAGLLSGKAGIVYCHIGRGKELLKPLWDVIETSEVTTRNFYPTHVSKSRELLSDAKKWVQSGGVVDFTADGEGEGKTLTALKEWRQEGVPMDRVTLSSDAYGSFPVFDEQRKVVGYKVGKQTSLLKTLCKLVDNGWGVEEAWSLCGKNVAKYLQLKGKGEIHVGFDADLLVFRGNMQPEKLELVVGRGELLKKGSWIKRGMFE
ncbi:isoaspartyl dipeptidase [Paraphysoderma sedebokerense]|nr:isoaspartyl dipeptidase [Paraphysoderma sedebokerense]